MILAAGCQAEPPATAAPKTEAPKAAAKADAPKANAPKAPTPYVPALKPARVIDVWPGPVPGETGQIAPENAVASGEPPVTRLSNVSKPTLAFFPAPADKDTGASVIVCPGGGYHILAIDKEGEEVAAWLNSIGVTGIVLKYRVPARKNLPRHLPPLQDAQRALSLVRARAAEWKLDPARIGILGFSAGGHLAACASTNFDRRAYDPIDDADKASCRPDFAVLVYPAYFLDKAGQFAPEIRPGPTTPPTFLMHCGDDRIPAENSVTYYQALKQASVPAEVHVFAEGGHGFGLRPAAQAAPTEWPRLCAAWLARRGLLQPARPAAPKSP